MNKGEKRKQIKSKSGTSNLEIIIERDACFFNKKVNGWRIIGELIRAGESKRSAKAHLAFQSIADSGQGELWGISDFQFIGSKTHISYDDSDSKRYVFSANKEFSSVPFECIVKPPFGCDPRFSGFRKVG